MAFTYLWVHNISICPLLIICHVGELSYLTYRSISRAVERCIEKIPTSPLNVFGELLGSLTPWLKEASGRSLRPLEQHVPFLLQLCTVPSGVQDVCLPKSLVIEGWSSFVQSVHIP